MLAQPARAAPKAGRSCSSVPLLLVACVHRRANQKAVTHLALRRCLTAARSRGYGLSPGTASAALAE
jgi:hypothetical protein